MLKILYVYKVIHKLPTKTKRVIQMAETRYPPILEKISHNVKVIWFGATVSEIKDAWAELGERIIQVHQPVDVEQLLDRKGFEDVQEDF